MPSSPLKQGEEVLLRKKKRFSILVNIFIFSHLLFCSLCRCRVLFSYQPVHDDELELKVLHFISCLGLTIVFSGWSKSGLHVWSGGWLVEGEVGGQGEWMIYTFWKYLGELQKQIFGKSWEFGPRRGGGGLTQSQLFFEIDQNLICLGTAHNVGILSQYGGGSPITTKKSPTLTLKMT